MLRRIKENNPLTAEIISHERTIYDQLNKNKHHKKDRACLKLTHINAYHKALGDIVDKLWSLSSNLFKQIDIDQVKTYKVGEVMPEAYQRYTRSSRNLSDFVVLELLNDKKYTLAIMAAERWLRVALDCFKRNDYFSASAIIGGLASYRLNPLKLDENLQESGRNIFLYLQHVFSNHISLYINLERKLEHNEKVIPALATLAIKLERLKSEPPGDDVDVEEHKQKQTVKAKRSMSKTMRTMQRNLVDDDQKDIVALLELFNVDPIQDNLKVKPQIQKWHLKSFLPSLLDQLKLYRHSDGVYGDWVRFIELSRQVAFLEIKARDSGAYDQWVKLQLIVKEIQSTEHEKLASLREMRDALADDNPLKALTVELVGAIGEVIRKQRTQSFASRSEHTRHYRQMSDNVHLQFSQPARLKPEDLKRIESGMRLRSAKSAPALRPEIKK